jgi:hypothetical protein
LISGQTATIYYAFEKQCTICAFTGFAEFSISIVNNTHMDMETKRTAGEIPAAGERPANQHEPNHCPKQRRIVRH